jgi:hypothetical protein
MMLPSRSCSGAFPPPEASSGEKLRGAAADPTAQTVSVTTKRLAGLISVCRLGVGAGKSFRHDAPPLFQFEFPDRRDGL